ncbi:TetR family transcriptional regulator, partial [Clostridium sp. cpc1]
MVRISKDPEVRKQEILEAAMKLFYMKGYEATSMADIA